MKKKSILKVGIVGCGAIGSSLAGILNKDFAQSARLVGLFDIDASKAGLLSRRICKSARLVAGSLTALVGSSDLVVEAASAASSWDIAQQAIKGGKDSLILSVGGIAPHYASLLARARKKGVRVYVPSGAVSGIDALKASGQGRLRKVVLTTRKNPRSFEGNQYVESKKFDLAGMDKDTLLYRGSAENAIRYFPQNVNVAALLSIAGLGLKRTQVMIIASPGVRNNIHELEIISDAGRVYTRTENVLHPDNPKTSYLAVLSAAAMLRQILEPVRTGT